MSYQLWTHDPDDYDLAGSGYSDFIDLCFKYSNFFSFIYYTAKAIPYELEPYVITSKITSVWPGTSTNVSANYCVYECNEFTRRYLKMSSDSLFSWINLWEGDKPEDLTFYRIDKSVFMCTISHESECYIFPRDAEDISVIFKDKRWKKSEYKIDKSWF